MCHFTPVAILISHNRKKGGIKRKEMFLTVVHALQWPYSLTACDTAGIKKVRPETTTWHKKAQHTPNCPSHLPDSIQVSPTVSPRLPSSPSSLLVRRNCRTRVHVAIVIKAASPRERSRAVGEGGGSRWDQGGHSVAR